MLSDEALDRIALEKGIKVGKEELEAEIYLLNQQIAHQRQYDALMHGMAMPDRSGDEEGREALIAQAMRNLRIEKLVKEIIRSQKFTVTPEELRAEAEQVAIRQNATLDMVRSFFGDDFAMLRQDVLEKKALAYLESLA